MISGDTKLKQAARPGEEFKAQHRAPWGKTALKYTEFPPPARIWSTRTKRLSNKGDLALGYSPGVAAPWEKLLADSANSFGSTAGGNLVAVETNATAVLGLGNLVPEAANPVMEAKGAFSKKFPGMEVLAMEIKEKDPRKLVAFLASRKRPLGGFTREATRARECFLVERELAKARKFPFFQEDHQATPLVGGAGFTTAFQVLAKAFKKAKLGPSGAGAAALPCLALLLDWALPRETFGGTILPGVF
ncbi:hypothetical protein [Ralstonia solanacearum]|uniref:hypothetical protein n=1 Tax=Ralstonia solanacearum TaxID=305 RepID=UPI000A0FA7C2|nr:hypothetical protein [Ralstonia solanacearum]